VRAEFRFYAELNDHLVAERRHRAVVKEFLVPASVKDLIESFDVPHSEVELVVVNGESVDFSRLVRDGDRVAVYPVFEGMDVTPELRIRPEALREARFVLDVHLGRLAAEVVERFDLGRSMRRLRGVWPAMRCCGGRRRRRSEIACRRGRGKLAMSSGFASSAGGCLEGSHNRRMREWVDRLHDL
jgi:hypothetical protein